MSTDLASPSRSRTVVADETTFTPQALAFLDETTRMIAANHGPVLRKTAQGWVVYADHDLAVGDMLNVHTRGGETRVVRLTGYAYKGEAIVIQEGPLWSSPYRWADTPPASRQGRTPSDKAHAVGLGLGIDGEVWDEEEMESMR